MLIRAVSLFLIASHSWAAGISIELEPVTTIGTFCYTDNEDSPSLCSNDDEDKVEEVIHEPHLRPVVFPVYTPEPDPIELAEVVESENEGIKSRQSTFQPYRITSDVYTTILDGELFMYENNGDFYRYHLNFDGANVAYSYPSLENYSYGFSLWFDYYDWDKSGGPEWHAMPMMLDKVNNIVWEWADPYTSVDSAGELVTDEGYWYSTQTSIRAPGELTGYVAQLVRKHGSGRVVSYIDEHDGVEGLWAVKYLNELDESGGNQSFDGRVSSVPYGASTMLVTHQGITQAYNDDVGNLHLRYLETDLLIDHEIELPFPAINIDAKTISTGTFYNINTEVGQEHLFFNAETGVYTYVEGSDDGVILDRCHKAGQGRLFCVIESLQNGVQLYELIDGEFYLDRSLSHLLLEQGLLKISGIFAHGENRFISIKTLDLKHRLFNFTATGSYHIAFSGLTGQSVYYEIASNEDDVFYWLGNTGAAVYATKFEVDIEEIVETIPDSEPTGPSEDDVIDTDGREVEEETEEEKEIPYAELPGSFSLVSLFLILLILSGRQSIYRN